MLGPVCKVLLDWLMNAESNAELRYNLKACYEQKYVSLKAEFNPLHLRCDELKSAAEDRLFVLAKAQADKHQIYIQSRPTLEKVDKDQKDGVVALELEKIAGSSGASESEMTVDLS
ncbi:hypothetical protein Tco_1040504 [Tanacetum coccineum]